MQHVCFIFLFRLITSIKIGGYFDERSSLGSIHQLSKLDLNHRTISSYRQVQPLLLQPLSIIHLPFSQSVIFNENILDTSKKPQFIELSYEESSVSEILVDTPSPGTVDPSIVNWTPLGSCVTNYAGDKATYRQTWSVELDLGLDFRVSYGGYFINFGPSYKTEFIFGKGIGGSYSCDVDPGNTLQFAILFSTYTVEGVRYRYLKRKKIGRGVRFGRWIPIAKYEQIGRSDIHVACFTQPQYLRCKTTS